ncbi:HAMP domain-containing histidine kinase [Candidatus Kaiserbacteria bacterium]|nr:HAMP domain-containing histidine kinase [Candidatus Kaiserbacteria bacterium]
MESLCPWEAAQYFVFSSNVPPLLYYSHLIAILAAVVFGSILLPQVRGSLPVKLFLSTIFFFSLWTIIDIPLWALNLPDVDLFLWSLQVLAEMFVYMSAFYFAYTFIFQKDLQFLPKVGLVILLAPIIVLLPTNYLFTGVDLSTCVISENSLLNFVFTYGIEIFLSLLILIVSYEGIVREPRRKMEIALFTTGILIFLLAFSSGNIIGSWTENWNVAQAGLFGMPVFIALLTYTVVKFKAFNIKLIATQALVIGIAVLIGARMFYSTTTIGTILSGVTLFAFLISGIFLVRSVKREVAQRELIQKQEQELEVVNKQQENLLHFISHEIKGYLTKSEAGFAAISEGDYGAIPEKLQTMSKAALADVRKGVRTVMEILDSSNLKKGTTAYTMQPFDLKKAILDVTEHLKPAADEKHIGIDIAIANNENYRLNGDETKLRQHVIRNLVDNAIKYTPKGTIRVELSDGNGKIHFSVKDSGVGITPEDMKNLFTEGGHGKDSIKINVHSTGYGLFIAKQVVEAHGGKIWAESEGAGKGSRFIVELPASAS